MREWINTCVAVIGLIFLIIGVKQIYNINVDLNEIKAKVAEIDNVKTKELSLPGNACIFMNGTDLIISNNLSGIDCENYPNSNI